NRDEIQESRNIEVAQLLLAEIHAAPGERVLDVGCGPGATALPLASAVGPAGHVIGIDISEPMLGLLRRRIAEQGIANLTRLLAAKKADAATRQAIIKETEAAFAAYEEPNGEVRLPGTFLLVTARRPG